MSKYIIDKRGCQETMGMSKIAPCPKRERVDLGQGASMSPYPCNTGALRQPRAKVGAAARRCWSVFFRSLKKCMDLPARWQASQRTPCPVLHPSCKRLRSLAPYGCNAASISPSGDKVMIRANARKKMRLTSAPTPNAPRRAARPFPYCTIE